MSLIDRAVKMHIENVGQPESSFTPNPKRAVKNWWVILQQACHLWDRASTRKSSFPLLILIFHPNQMQVFVKEDETAGKPDLHHKIKAEEIVAEVREGHRIRELPAAGDEEQADAAGAVEDEESSRELTERDKKMVQELRPKMSSQR